MEDRAYVEMAAVEARHWWFVGRRRVLAAVIARLGLPRDAAILELGSGTGGNFSLLARFGRVTAVEMNEAAREISRGRPGVAELRAGSLPQDLNLGGRTFDLICLFDVLEHVEDDTATLAAMRAHLAPAGAAVITVPAYKALFGPHDVALHHKRRYEYAELEAALRAAGLRIETLSFINAALLPVAWVLRQRDKARHGGASFTGLPPAPVNAVLAWLFGAEAWLLPRIRLPFGLSLLAVVRRAE